MRTIKLIKKILPSGTIEYRDLDGARYDARQVEDSGKYKFYGDINYEVDDGVSKTIVGPTQTFSEFIDTAEERKAGQRIDALVKSPR